MYKPTKKSGEILGKAIQHILSVPYAVSLRWVFYRLLQDGLYSKKGDYNKWKALSSAARKNFYGSWAPDTLVDDTREILRRNGGYLGEDHLRQDYLDNLIEDNPVRLDHFFEQEKYVFICFEARAMADQFRYYTKRINLVPFGGDPSIPLKWELAKSIEHWEERYEKDVIILYFGDYDPKGEQIYKSAMNDVSIWCDVPFSIFHCGLSYEQAVKYNVPENPEKPGEYQWEALDDTGAAEIINEAIKKYVDVKLIDEIEGREIELTEEFREKLSELTFD